MSDMSDDNETSSNCSNDWQEITEPIKCLFCEDINQTINLAVQHLETSHHLNLPELQTKFNMDQYSYIKLINYIASENVCPETINTATVELWKDDKYLGPVDKNLQSWLIFDFEEYVESHNKAQPSTETIVLKKQEVQQMQSKINNLTSENISLRDLNEQLRLALEKLRTSALRSLEENIKEDVIGKSTEVCVGNLKSGEDESYFSTYAHYGIHHEMLSDQVRTESYRDAILNNADIIRDKVVLDLGCGTSILSMFAVKAGAKQVIAIDQSDIIYQAMDIVQRNNINNINFVKGRIEDSELPVDKVDIIISEWMGYFLLFEGMLDSLIYARNRHLKPGGILMPNKCNISLIGYGDENRHKEIIQFWTNVYGFDMRSMQDEVLKEATVEICNPEYCLTEPNIISEFNLMTVDLKSCNFSYNFNLKVTKSGTLTSLVGYFDTFFDLPNKVEFTTSPASKSTHWKQVIFYFKNIQTVRKDEVISGRFHCQRNRKDVRSLLIQIEIFGQTLKYKLD